MKWNLSPKETAGVAAVGFAMAWALDKITDEEVDFTFLAGVSVIYMAGVVIGTNRPPGGWIDGQGQLMLDVQE